MKAKIILLIVRFLMGAIALGLGIWYVSSSINGDAITYTSLDSFLTAIGGGEDISNTNGCFLCKYISQLFGVLGDATETFWQSILNFLLIVIAIGFGVFLFIYTGQYIYEASKKTAKLDTNEKSLEFKEWFDKVWHQGARVLVCVALLGGLSFGGTNALRYITKITVTPVMFVGAELGMAATGVSDSTQCGAMDTVENSDDILNPVLQPFMCSIGNLNSVMLAGAAGGFSMMNYSALGLGGGAFTWLSGLALVIMFLLIGFDLFFKVLTIVFKLIFIIIFMPIFIGAAAFEQVWKPASGLVKKTVETLVSAAIQIVSISLKIVLMYATVYFAADANFPGPVDGFSVVMPPILGQTSSNTDSQTAYIQEVFSECERVSLVNGLMDEDRFKTCFERYRSANPSAFEFLGNGWEFLMLAIGLFFMYYWVISPEVDKILKPVGNSDFDFGANIKNLGKNIWNIPQQLTKKITSSVGLD